VPTPEEAPGLVEKDVDDVLRTLLPPGDGFKLSDTFADVASRPIARDGTVAVVAWEWSGQHEREILGIAPPPSTLPPPLQQDPPTVTVRGVTIVTDLQDAPQYHRYIDWGDVLVQLGARFYGRPITVLDPDAIRAIPELAGVDFELP
jgi:hypothetical protein